MYISINIFLLTNRIGLVWCFICALGGCDIVSTRKCFFLVLFLEINDTFSILLQQKILQESVDEPPTQFHYSDLTHISKSFRFLSNFLIKPRAQVNPKDAVWSPLRSFIWLYPSHRTRHNYTNAFFQQLCCSPLCPLVRLSNKLQNFEKLQESTRIL